MISVAFAKELGFKSRTEFYKLVKSKSLKDKEIFERIIVKYGNPHEDDVDNDYYALGAHGNAAYSCCGVAEIGGVTNSPIALKSEVANALIVGFRCVVYYSVDDKTRKACDYMGFKNITAFNNHNHGTRITVHVLNVLED